MHITPKTPEVRVPRLDGLIAMDARTTAEATGLFASAAARPAVHPTAGEYD